MEKVGEDNDHVLMRIYPSTEGSVFNPRDFRNSDVRNRLFNHYRHNNLLTQYKTLRRNQNYRKNKNLIVRVILNDSGEIEGCVEDNRYTGFMRGKYRKGLKIKGMKVPVDYSSIKKAYLLRK